MSFAKIQDDLADLAEELGDYAEFEFTSDENSTPRIKYQKESFSASIVYMGRRDIWRVFTPYRFNTKRFAEQKRYDFHSKKALKQWLTQQG